MEETNDEKTSFQFNGVKLFHSLFEFSLSLSLYFSPSLSLHRKHKLIAILIAGD